MEKSHYVEAVLMDLSKAFDCLPHYILLYKLLAYGLSSRALQMMASYLSNRKQRIKIGNILAHGQAFVKEYHKGLYLGTFYSIFLLMMF